ncbi:hypothetical protein FQN57_000598 [Myotisia sp. PD_48]|nr:hypothetical protein FQN57_000598 [Myotisia sp. PD_48]
MQGFNMGRYVPPDQEGVVSGNKLAGKHPLGSRARNLQTTGELTVRFEMPFAIWCTTCNPPESVMIGQGVRFNALKRKVGNYYSTPIFSFRMKHSICGGWIEIRTDPKNTEYVVTEGASRKITPELRKGEYEECTTGAAEIRIKLPGENDTGEAEKVDPFAALEGKVVDRRKYMTEEARIEELKQRQDRDWEDPYEKSKRLRRIFRTGRKLRETAQIQTDALKDKLSLGIDLVDETEGDRLRAGAVDFPRSSQASEPSWVSSSALKRPLFEPSPSERPQHTSKKKKSRTDIAAEQQALFQQEVSRNTRATIDPFLFKEGENVWQLQVKSGKLKDKAGGLPVHPDSTIPAVVHTKRNGSPADVESSEGKNVTGNEESPGFNLSPDELQPIQAASLVAYGSDSD